MGAAVEGAPGGVRIEAASNHLHDTGMNACHEGLFHVPDVERQVPAMFESAGGMGW